MATETPLFILPGIVAAADLSTAQFKLVKLTADHTVNVAGAGEESVGILQDKPDHAGEAASVVNLGVSKVRAGAAFSAGARLKSDASGRATAAVATDPFQATALEAATAADQIITVLVERGITQ